MPNNKNILREKINEAERKILEVLSESYDSSGWEETGYYSFDPLVKTTGIDRKKVRLACRSLARKGLAKYMRGLINSDGGMGGAGYGATREGASLINPCDECDDLAIYDWWEKDGKIVFKSVGTEHFVKCEEHYEAHKKDRSTIKNN